MPEKAEGMLSPYRVLDLADETGLLCGKILGDLGADVIKIEKPGGDPARRLGPFYHDDPDPEKSLFWFAYNTNKRGITLNIETADGREIFKRLVKTADFVIETFPPGYLNKLGLGYSALEKLNSKIILVSITPFGQSGPWKNYKAPELVAWALSGQMYTWGDADRPPVHISHHSQSHLHAGADAAVGAIMALFHRETTGVGQQINATVRWSAIRAAGDGSAPLWYAGKINEQRGGGSTVRENPGIRLREVWPCKDGFVLAVLGSTSQGRFFGPDFVEWMKSEGMADDFLIGLDWGKFDMRTITQETVDRIEEQVAGFYLKHTKAELYNWSVKHDQQLNPVNTAKDVLESDQLAARNFWVKLDHPELGTSITYPGASVKTTEAPIRICRRAPLIGEHNQEIYGGELGISKEELSILKQTGII